VANGYSWNDARDGGTYRLPGPEHLGWWASVALFVSILLHVVVFLALDHFKIALEFSETREITTAPMNVEQVEVTPLVVEPPPPEEVIVPPSDSAALLEEVDLLAKLPKDEELDIKPDVLTPEYALKMTNPAQEGEPEAVLPALSAGMEIESDLPDLGKMEETLPPAAVGQITVDPGAVPMDDLDLDKFTNDIVKKGARGKMPEGALDGITSLDDLLDLPAKVLVSKKTLLPSDLLFEFNSAELRESAKVGLMKLGLLIDRNPNLYCWVEGHTDLIGTEAANLDLSRRRAAAVRDYLVKSLRMDADKIIPRGKGEFEPLIAGGSVAEQAPNRRVEIRMRKEPPPAEPDRPIPRAEPAPAPAPAATTPAPRAKPAPPEAEEPPPRAVPVKPPRALPVEEEPPTPPKAEPAPPKAEPVEELPELPSAPKAEPVDPNDPVEVPRPAAVPRAEAVEE
jgi:outer membrane protein OmpA-like peptidoglycan-associated protein